MKQDAAGDDLERAYAHLGDGLGLGGVEGPAAALCGVLDDGRLVRLLLQAGLAQEPDSLHPGGLAAAACLTACFTLSVVTSESMVPTLLPRDVVLVEKVTGVPWSRPWSGRMPV